MNSYCFAMRFILGEIVQDSLFVKFTLSFRVILQIKVIYLKLIHLLKIPSKQYNNIYMKTSFLKDLYKLNYV